MSNELRVAVSDLCEGPFQLSSESSRYVAKVHRKRQGERIVLFDPSQKKMARATIVDISPARVFVTVESIVEAELHNMPVSLVQVMGKGDKPEQAVRDATALGVEEIILATSERSVSHLASESKRSRLEKISQQVARQCERGDLPRLTGPSDLGELLSTGRLNTPCGLGELRLVCCWHERMIPLLEAVEPFDWGARQLTLLVGPEGGLSQEEIGLALMAGFVPVSLGPYVLRTESACTVALGALRMAAERAVKRA